MVSVPNPVPVVIFFVQVELVEQLIILKIVLLLVEIVATESIIVRRGLRQTEPIFFRAVV